MPSPDQDRWQRVKEKLRAEVGEDIFQSWFARMELERVEANTSHLSVPTRFLRSWIQSHYTDRVLACWQGESPDIQKIEVSVRSAVIRTAPPKQPGPEAIEPHRDTRIGRLDLGEMRATYAPVSTGHDALGGSPGVLSARYATLFGGAKDDAENNRVLLQQLQGHADRRARFVSVLVALRSAEDPEPLVAMGRWHGEVLAESRGEGGFGYDPLMFIPALGKTVAQLGAEEKNRHSHRAQAARQMLALMQEVWQLG